MGFAAVQFGTYKSIFLYLAKTNGAKVKKLLYFSEKY